MIAIHQSQFLPWIPYFFKISKSDIFVILDDVQYQKNGVQNRNKIKTPQGELWLTIPVKVNLGAKINEVEISKDKSIEKILKTIELNYKRSSFYDNVYPIVESAIYNNYKLLVDLNNILIMDIFNLVGLSPKIKYSSYIKTTKSRDDLVIEIIKYFGEKNYLSGKGALNYMDLNKFKKEGINIYTFDFKYAEYPQLWEKRQGFIPNLSILDLLFNNLKDTQNYIHKNGVIKILT